ncbi:MAG: phosphoribosylformylglycinamidine synthase subunit PurS [Nitrospinae bacterium]|nr:phosphoribosylformylglycinamidine synthase subunit PurS [Nitrospinota bacterium]
MFTAKVFVSPKKNVLDPQGKAVHHALESLGFEEINDVRVGKYIEVKVNRKDKAAAEAEVKRMCDSLLVNPVVEEYTFDISAE